MFKLSCFRRSVALSAAVATASISALVLACGCGRPRAALPKTTAASPATPGRTGSAALAGTVRFSGPIPDPVKTKVSNDSYCRTAVGPEVADESLLVSPSGGLANVFVWVRDGISGSYPPPKTPVLLDQKGCVFHPRVFGLVAGQELRIRSEDATLHNVHAKAEKNPSFNLAMPSPGTEHTKRFDAPEIMVKIRCDVHGWMRAFAGVVAHPFFAVTDREGDFSIAGVPSGTYTLEAWHESLGALERTVTVAEDRRPLPPQDFTFTPAASASAPRGTKTPP